MSKKLVPAETAGLEGRATPLELLEAGEFSAELPVRRWAMMAYRAGKLERYTMGGVATAAAVFGFFVTGDTLPSGLLVAWRIYTGVVAVLSASFIAAAHLISEEFEAAPIGGASDRLAALGAKVLSLLPVTIVNLAVATGLVAWLSAPFAPVAVFYFLIFGCLLSLTHCLAIQEAAFGRRDIVAAVVKGWSRALLLPVSPRSSDSLAPSGFRFFLGCLRWGLSTLFPVLFWGGFCLAVTGLMSGQPWLNGPLQAASLAAFTFASVQVVTLGAAMIGGDQILQLGAEGELALRDRSGSSRKR